MGLFDKIKNNVKQAFPPQAQQQAHTPVQHAPEPEPELEQDFEDDAPSFDLAGFDPDDERAFFTAVLHMESEGQFGGTDESRAEIMARYGIRDRSHWHVVKESVYSALIQRYGSMDEVGQREFNWRSGQMQRHMQQQVAKTAAGGGSAPVEGVSLESWAATNAAIVSGASLDDLLKGQGLDKARWDRASAEWNARMARDTTFAIAQVYGNAFQAASQGKYASYAKEAAAARAANRELAMDVPVSLEQYWEIMFEQSYAGKQGRDPVAALKSCGLTIVDWTDLSTFMGYFFHRTAVRNQKQYEATFKKVEAAFAAKYPGVKADLDISF